MGLLRDAGKSKVRNIFIGSEGIRAGWSALLFLVIFVSVGAIATMIVRMTHLQRTPQDSLTLSGVYFDESVTVAMILIATAVMARVERKPFGTFGLGDQHGVQKLALGLATGFICLTTVVGMMYFSGHLIFDGIVLQGFPIFTYAILWLGGFLLAAGSEEMLFRGYLQNTLFRGMGPWPSVLVLSLLFTLGHLGSAGENALGLIFVFASGVFLSLLRWRSGSLWLGIGFHAAWNWSQSYLYGTPNSGHVFEGHLMMTRALGDMKWSGGTAGPEASLLSNPVVLVGLAALLWQSGRSKSRAIG